MWVAILFLKQGKDLLPLISFGSEFHTEAPSYMKLLFMLLCGVAANRGNLICRGVHSLLSHFNLLIKKSASDFGPIVFSNLNISFAFVFILSTLRGSQPNAPKAIVWSVSSLFMFIIIRACRYLLWSFWSRLDYVFPKTSHTSEQ